MKIQREWLKRIPAGTWIRRKGGKEFLPPGEEEAFEADAFAPDDEETELQPPQGEPDDSTQSAADEDGEDSAKKSAEEAKADPPSPEDNTLHIPDEEQRRREEERQKKARSLLNLNLAPKAFGLEGHYLRGLATQFARMVSKVAEDSADLPQPGDEEWDVVALSQRRFTGHHIHQCRITRDKRKVVVVLDTSPSCEHQARLFGAIAHIAEDLGDCELYDAPNFAIVSRKNGETWEALPETEREWHFKHRVVLAFGDFDGISRINTASAVRGNKIYWFSCEARPLVLETHREDLVKGFKGHYFPAANMNQLMRAMRKVR